MPLAISHVNPNSPVRSMDRLDLDLLSHSCNTTCNGATLLQAGHCVPALLEGDQVLLINGRDISEHTHQQVVMYIKASRESHSKELALLVRRKGLLIYCEKLTNLGNLSSASGFARSGFTNGWNRLLSVMSIDQYFPVSLDQEHLLHTLTIHMYTCSFIQVSNQPIM